MIRIALRDQEVRQLDTILRTSDDPALRQAKSHPRDSPTIIHVIGEVRSLYTAGQIASIVFRPWNGATAPENARIFAFALDSVVRYGV
jgi:hypothetical protein